MIIFFFFGGGEEKLLLLFIRIPITFYITIHYFLHLYKASQPQSGAFDTVVLTPYIIPILGLNRPVSRDYVGRSAEGT